MLREGMFIAERYEVLERIGSGGMSEVYKAMDHKLNRYVAMKVLKSDYSEDKTFVTKFRAEAQSAAGLMHSNIVNVYDVGEEEGLHYIVMELVEGITLKKYIERKGRLGTREAVSIAIQVAQGMEAAHRHHIVHRDIKPQNIIISKEGKVKVTDFGIARAATSNTINSAVMGSVHYISPEQARGGYSDEKSDIYSFGITLFEMVTGQVPFEGDSTVSVALQHIQDDMASPKTIVPDLPVSVEKIILKCTQKKTERRYQNVSDLIVDLKRSLVTPDEDFVIISTAIPSDGATHIIGEDDLIEISQRTATKAATSDLGTMGLGYEDDEPVEADEYEDDYDANEDLDAEEEEDSEADEYDEDDLDDEPKRNKTLDLIITIAGILLAVAIIVATVLLLRKMLGQNQPNRPTPSGSTPASTMETDEVEVPNLSGYTYEQAREALREKELGIKSVSAYSDVYEEGIVFDQDYEPGESVKKNTTITVTISKGFARVELDNVINKTQEEAEAILNKLGVKINYKYEETENQDKVGKVAQTQPMQGSMVTPGDIVTVTVYIASDVKNNVVPNVVGLKESEARKTIEENHFVVGRVTRVHDATVPEGIVISQSGAEVDEEAPEGSVINFILSLGEAPTETEAPTEKPTEPPTEKPTEPPTEKPTETQPVKVSVPTIVGKTLEDAKKAVLDAKLKVGVVTEEFSDSVAKGTVISITGASEGDSVTEGTEIGLVVSKGKKINEYSVTATIDSSYVTDALGTVSYENTMGLRCEFVLHYKDASGSASTKTLATVIYSDFNDMKSKAPFNVNNADLGTSGKFTDENFDSKETSTVTVKITYFPTGATGEEEWKDLPSVTSAAKNTTVKPTN